MLGVDPILKFVTLVLASGYLKGEKPISCLIISNPEHGKTESLMHFRGIQNTIFVSDATAFGISNRILPRIQTNLINHIIFPDFLRIVTRGKNVVNELLSLLNVIVEDGLSGSIYTGKIDFSYPESEKRKYAGVIIAITPDALKARRKKLIKYGFFSRMLPCYFHYNEDDSERIHEEIKGGELLKTWKPMKFPKKPRKIKISKKMADKLDYAVKILTPVLGAYKGFRLRKQLQRLAKSNAFINKRGEVTEEDIREVYSFVPFMFNPIGGDACMWEIMKSIPGTHEEIVNSLENRYSRSTIKRRLGLLRSRYILIKDTSGSQKGVYRVSTPN